MLKNSIRSGNWKFQWVLALGFLASTGAWAVPADMTVNLVGGNWTIGDDTVADPNEPTDQRVAVDGAPWTKTLNLLTSTSTVSSNDDPIDLFEHLKLVSGKDLDGWTETIVGPAGWIWDSSIFSPFIHIRIVDGNLRDDEFDVFFTGSGTSILIATFDLALAIDFWTAFPADAYVTLDISKSLGCAPDSGGNEAFCTGPIQVLENPAPEPGTLLLLAGGLAGLAGLRRRRYA